MKRTGLCGLLVALAVAMSALWSGCSDDSTTGNDNNNVPPGCGNGIVEEELGEACDNGPHNSDLAPDACRTSCQLSGCGDDVRDTGEDCDGDDLDGAICADLPPLNHGTLRCNLDCEFDTDECYQCGDGTIDPGEECDTNNLGEIDSEPANCGNVTGKPDGELACLMDCMYDISECALCGDGLIEGPEECDDASDNSDQPNADCRLNCQLADCGDGIWDFLVEGCDCGTDASGIPFGCVVPNGDGLQNGCSINCEVPVCGDNKVDNLGLFSTIEEQCDDGSDNCDDPSLCSCTSTCAVMGCGDAIFDPAIEDCDCGNDASHLGEINGTSCITNNCDTNTDCECATNCTWPGCGNGIVEPYMDQETCDLGTANCNESGCTCSTTCKAHYCGNGAIEAYTGEECDDGSGNCESVGCACNTICTVVRCGNGVEEGDEQCDCGDDLSNKPALCTSNNCTGPSCTCAPNCTDPGCGNGVLEAHLGESCDEGSAINCDTDNCTCSTTCRLPWETELAEFSGSTLFAVSVFGNQAVAVGATAGITWNIQERDASGNWTPGTIHADSQLVGVESLRDVCRFVDGRMLAVGTNGMRMERDATGQWDHRPFGTLPGATLTGVVCLNTYPNSYYITNDGRVLDVVGDPVFDNGNGTPYWGINFYQLVLWAGDIVGDAGDRVKYDQNAPVNQWTAVPLATAENLRSTWADQYDYRFIVGTGGAIWHHDGTAWSSQSAGTTEDLYGVGGFGANAWAVGSAGTILHYDGTNWTAETALTVTGALLDVDDSGTLVLAVGENGVVVRRP